jgi:hypothetical protein
MMIFLILAPYAAFTLPMLAGSVAPSLFAAAAICLMVIGVDVFRGRAVKLLGAGSAILFASLGGYLTLIDPGLSPSTLKLAVDCGMLAIALLSLAIRFPFTLQYAREVVDAQTASLPGFLMVNNILTAVWALAFLLMLMANVLMIYLPGLPLWLGLAIAFAARNTALYFTRWYPRYRRAKFASSAGVLSGS